MPRSLARYGVALLSGAIVLAYGMVAWREAGRRGREAAEAQARALVGAVAAGLDASVAAGRALEETLAERLVDLAVDLDRRLGERPGGEQRTLEVFCRAHRLRGAVLLGPDLEPRAVASGRPPAPAGSADGGPFDPERLLRLEAAALARRARDAGLDRENRVVLGFGESPFTRRGEYLVGVDAPAAGGHLLLRLDAEELARFEREAGVRRVLTDATAAPGITYLEILGEDGGTLVSAGAAHGTTTADRVLDVVVPAAWDDATGTAVRVGFDAAPVDAVIAEGRRDVVVFTALVLAIGAAGFVALGIRERRELEREERLRRELEARERFASLGRLAAGVAHEVRSPLNALSMAAQRLPREAAPADAGRRRRFDALVTALRESVGRVDRTVEVFLAMGRDPPPAHLREIDVAALVRATVETECPGAEAEGTALRALADPELLARAVANLLRNAREAAPAGTVSIRWRDAGGHVEIVVADGGPGVPAADADAVFEPFHTRRKGGTGLGLYLAREGVRRCGGDVVLLSGEGTGARFAIRIPGGAA